MHLEDPVEAHEIDDDAAGDDDWMAIDALDLEIGRSHGKLREELTSVDEMLKVLEERRPQAR